MSNREIFIDKLKQLTHEEILERYIALLNTEKLTDYVSDLEAKLAEKEKKIEKLKSENHALISDNAYQEADMFEFNSRIEQLQKQLAEKEQTIAEYKLYIESFKHSQDLNKKYISKLESDLAEKCRLLKTNETLLNGTKFIEEEINRDKISFAVEQLEKVKELLFSKAIQLTGTSVDTVRLYSINEIFNNQIKALKEGK